MTVLTARCCLLAHRQCEAGWAESSVARHHDVVVIDSPPQLDTDARVAVRAADTISASEREPRRLKLNGEILTPGTQASFAVVPGTATLIATGGMVPRGADAVIMIEHTEALETADGTTAIELRRPAASGQFIAFAGSDIARGETALYVSFDEAADQIVRNLASVGLDLQVHRDAGLLHIRSMRTAVMSAEAHFIRLKGLITELKPQSLVLDPISALAKTGGHVAAVHASLRILRMPGVQPAPFDGDSTRT